MPTHFEDKEVEVEQGWPGGHGHPAGCLSRSGARTNPQVTRK
jgi:hypothetical protein